MSTAKLNTKVVNASVNSPAPKAPASKEGTVFRNATFRKFGYKVDGDTVKTVVTFETQEGKFLTAQVHPAIRWADKIGTKADIVVDTDCTPWKSTMRPTKEELDAYIKATTQVVEKVVISKQEQDFLASF